MAHASPKRSQPVKTAAARRDHRKNGRRERSTLRYSFSLYTPPDQIADPVLHLEKQRGAYIARLEEIMDAAALDPKLSASIAVQLLKLGSLGKIRSDFGEQLAKLVKEPDLTAIDSATLARLIAGEAIEVPQLEAPAIDVTPGDDDDTSTT